MKNLFFLAVSFLFALSLAGCNGDSSSSDSPYSSSGTSTTSSSGSSTPSTNNTSFHVIASNIGNGTSSVSVSSPIVLTFNTPVDSGSLFYNSGIQGTGDDVKLEITSDSNNSNPQEIAISTKVASNVLTITPLVSLIPNTAYSLKIEVGVHDTSDPIQDLENDYTLNFTTAPDPAAQPKVTVLTFDDNMPPLEALQGQSTFQVSYFQVFWDTKFHGVPVAQTNGDIVNIPPPASSYPNTEGLVTNPSTPYVLSTDVPSMRFMSTLPNTMFTSGNTYFFAVKACGMANCSTYSNEVGKTMP